MGTRVMVMAGGTGGHVFPALAVAEELRRRGCELSWLGAPDSFEARTVPQRGIPLDSIGVVRLRGQGAGALLAAPVRLLRALWQAARVLRRRRPQVVLGMGGFVSGPGGLVSRLLGIPLVIHEQNAIAGLTNSWLSRIASRVVEAFPGTFPASRHAVAVGNPVRPEISDIAEPSLRLLGHEGPVRLLVLGGSLGAKALNELLPQAVALLEPMERPQIRHQAGRERAEEAAQNYLRLGVEAEVTEFVEDMAAAYTWADLVVCRAGALTCSELMNVGLAAVLIPFPFAVDDHQTVNARFLVQAGAAELAQQRDLDPAGLAGLLRRLLGDRDLLLRMARQGRQLARPDATSRVADLCLEVAR